MSTRPETLGEQRGALPTYTHLSLHPSGPDLPPAVASFLSFVGGAFLPLAPYLATRGETAFFGMLAVTLVSLLAIGALMTLFTGRRPLPSALRMALLGTMAAGATYAIGSLLGVVG